jgi:hypothetical protein
MDASTTIDDFLLREVRHTIPAALLGVLGDRAELIRLIQEHLTTAKGTLGDEIRPSIWRTVSRYVVSKIKFNIFELYPKRENDITLEPRLLEFCSEYDEADERAELVLLEIKDICRKYGSIRRS